jgi:hypothetical protein
MVKVDWPVMVADIGEPVEKSWLPSALPLARVPEGPVTTQEVTPLALQESVVLLPEVPRAGLAEIVAVGESTNTEANAGAEEPPAPEQTT